MTEQKDHDVGAQGWDRTFVKPLEWHEVYSHREDGGKEVIGWEADCGFGVFYGVDEYFGSDSFGFEVCFDAENIGDVDDPIEAKNIAQRHFAEKIRAALVPPYPQSGQMTRDKADYKIGWWLSGALEDPSVCAEMKADINAWFEAHQPGLKMEACSSSPSPGEHVAKAVALLVANIAPEALASATTPAAALSLIRNQLAMTSDRTLLAQGGTEEMENYRMALAYISRQSTDQASRELAETAIDAFHGGSALALAGENLMKLDRRVLDQDAEIIRLRDHVERARAHAKTMRNSSKLVGPLEYAADPKSLKVWQRALYHEGKQLMEILAVSSTERGEGK